jgi:hypothetical protein
MKSHLALSQELHLIERDFVGHETAGLTLSGGDVRRLCTRLSLLGKLAKNLEQELAIYRLIDAGRIQADILGKTALDVAGEAILAAEGNVVRPDFGRKK